LYLTVYKPYKELKRLPGFIVVILVVYARWWLILASLSILSPDKDIRTGVRQVMMIHMWWNKKSSMFNSSSSLFL